MGAAWSLRNPPSDRVAPVTLLPSLAMFTGGSSHFAASQTGTLVYGTGGVGGSIGIGTATPVWVERDGTAREIESDWVVGTPAQLLPAWPSLPTADQLLVSRTGFRLDN